MRDNDNIVWDAATVANCNNEIAYIDNRLEENIGSIDQLVHTLDLSKMNSSRLQFDVAYARYDASPLRWS